MPVASHRVLYGLIATVLLAGCATGTTDADAVSASGSPSRAAAPTVPAPPPASDPVTKKWIDLQVGDCVADLPPADLSRVDITMIDCATAHLAEVYRRAPVAVDSAIATVADRECAAGFAPYTGQSVDGSPYKVTWLIDSRQDRTGADPTPSTVICLLQAVNGQRLTGSARR